MIKDLAITIYVSNAFSHKSDIGRWADSVLSDSMKEKLKEVHLVDDKYCVKKTEMTPDGLRTTWEEFDWDGS